MTKTPGFRRIKKDKKPSDIEIPISDIPPENLRELYETFLRYNSNFKDGRLLTVLTRYIVPILGGSKPRGARASKKEKEAALEFLSNQKLLALVGLDKKIEAYFESEKIPKSQRYNPRSIFKSLLSWTEKQDFINCDYQPEEEFLVFRHTRVDLKDDAGATYTREGEPGKFQQLGMPEDFVAIKEPSKKDVEKAKGEILEILQKKPTKNLAIALLSVPLKSVMPDLVLANKELENEIEEFTNFSRTTLKRSDATIDGNVRQFLQILNWMKTKKPLNELTLKSIIPDVRLPHLISINEFKNQENRGDALWIAKGEAEELVQKVKKQIKSTLELYFKEGTKAGANSKVNTTKALVNLCKWVYYEQTEDFSRERGYRDIPFIAVIRQLGNDLNREHEESGNYARHKRNKKEKMIPWNLLVKATHLAFLKLEQENKYMLGRKTNGDLRVKKTYRGDSAIIRDFQNALILAITTALPPGRSKVYYQLKLGENLVKGAYIASGAFRNFDELSEEQKKNARWWFRLTPDEGKRNTIKREGWEAPIPNLEFITGKTLYEYLEDWIENWRPLLKPSHNFLYSTENGNKPLDSSNYGGKFFRTVRRFVGKGVRPHLTRAMLITYCYEQGMTDAERRSLADCQRHLLETQEKIYNEIEQLKALQPALEMTERFAENVLEELRLDPQLQEIYGKNLSA